MTNKNNREMYGHVRPGKQEKKVERVEQREDETGAEFLNRLMNEDDGLGSSFL